MTAVGAVSGTRAFVAGRHVTAALLASATLVSGSGHGSGQQAADKAPAVDGR